MIKLALIIFLLFCSSVSAMSPENRSTAETLAGVTLKSPSIAYYNINIGSTDVLNMWVVPVLGRNSTENDYSIQRAISAASITFILVKHSYPEISKLSLTVAEDKENPAWLLYGLGSWADSVRWEGDQPNMDDMYAVHVKIWGTMKSVEADTPV